MIKAMHMLKRRAGMTPQDFIEHCETKYAPLVENYLTTMTRYQRHYIRPLPYPLDGKLSETAYDLLAEIWFDDHDAFMRGMDLLAAEEASTALGEAERQFTDPAISRFVVIEEHESVLPGRTSNPSDMRSFVLLKRKPGTTLEQFIDYYETTHHKLGIKYSGEGMSRYRRLFLRPAAYPLGGAAAEPAYDVVTEVSFSRDGAASEASGAMSDPEVNRIVEEDESNFVDKSVRNFAVFKTRESVLPRVAEAAG